MKKEREKTAKIYYSRGFEVGDKNGFKKGYTKGYEEGGKEMFESIRKYVIKTFRIDIK